MNEKILIIDFGSQYTQLIARVIREFNVFCEIIPFNKSFEFNTQIKGIILSGSPSSVNELNAPEININHLADNVPVLGICYGAQLTAKLLGGVVDKKIGRAHV